MEVIRLLRLPKLAGPDADSGDRVPVWGTLEGRAVRKRRAWRDLANDHRSVCGVREEHSLLGLVHA